ncbi:uncharacterized protein LOC115797303 [Archocentrus centrarchus]|uniref:uncharacterized protein LOC115797303 n=1 Tax=Archocentrus centrarchus TaxID=63155 RepID=UPI0011EA0512|nr:uncharacterized protein LOC115797303 [Archocentrus centrarchus]XP_030609704.1 uncharacterized protein LOC115797303 [Archocentrus centrarchus]
MDGWKQTSDTPPHPLTSNRYKPDELPAALHPQALRELRTMSRVFMVVVLISLVPGISSPDHQRIFTRHTGTNVILEFPVPTDTTSIWLNKADSNKYIFYCRDGHPTHLKDQEESFKGRVEGTDCDKINGTVTITLSNLTSSDSGTYEFQGMESDGRRFNETIILIVTDPVNPLVYVLCAGPVVCIIIGLIYKGRRRKPQIRTNEPSVELDLEEENEDDDDTAHCLSEKKSPLMNIDSAVVPNVSQMK